MSEGEITEYGRRYDGHLRIVAENLQSLVAEYLDGVPRIDRVAARAKAPQSFAAKARKANDDGTARYAAPLTQIQDQIGVRVIVFYWHDIESVAAVVERYFRPVERRDIVPDSEWKFGYFGRHWVFALPDDVVPSEAPRVEVPRFFELQVKTLFQHAWAEANHDLAYKAPQDLTDDQVRRVAFTSAQAWGADRIFEELRAELGAE